MKKGQRVGRKEREGLLGQTEHFISFSFGN